MINPSDEDIGRRVRWLSRRRNIGTLTSFNDTWAFVQFPFEAEPMPAACEDLFWADDNLGTIATADSEGKPARMVAE